VAFYCYFSTFDLKSAYHQILIVPSERKYMVFEANGRLFQFKRIPFYVTSGGVCFQRMMDKLIQKENLNETFCYMDNLTVGGHSQEQHGDNVKKRMDLLGRYKFTLNDSKTIRSVSVINVLGYRVGCGVIRPDPDRLQALQSIPLPENPKPLERVMGMFAYYSKWLPRFSDQALPLRSSSFPLDDSARKAFESLKKQLEAATLRAIDESQPFVGL